MNTRNTIAEVARRMADAHVVGLSNEQLEFEVAAIAQYADALRAEAERRILKSFPAAGNA